MAKQLTVRNVPDAVAEKLDAMSREQGESVNTIVVKILSSAAGVSERREHLRRYVTWAEQDAETFDDTLKAQRRVDEELWD